MHRSAIGFITTTLCLLALVAHSLAVEKEVKPMSLSLTSSAFAHNGTIPQAYTCDGKDISPPFGLDRNSLGNEKPGPHPR